MYLIFLIIPIILSAEESTNSFTSWRTAYITSVEEGEYVTVFNKPGLNWKYCDKEIDPKTGKEKCKDAVGWLAAGSRVKVYSEEPKKAITQDPITGEWLEETYIRVDYVYGRPDNEGKSVLQFGSGYVEAYNVSDQPKPTFFGTPAKNMFESLPKENPSCPQSQPITGMKDKEQDCQRITTALENMGVNRTAEKLNEIVGFCAINPPDKFPKRIPRGNPYDDFIYSQLVKKKPPEITGENGRAVTNDDLVNIDAMARTLYGEMGKCFRYGLHYPIAVAKVIVNRVEATHQYKTFIRPPHDERKPIMSKATTTASQFSMWHKTKKGKDGNPAPNGPLHQGLCPPREQGKPFYHGKEASKYENDIWMNSLKIATEAVLFPEKFNRRTKQITQKHYTSDLSRLRNTPQLNKGARFINKMTLAHPSIEKRQIDNNRCLEMWNE